jgi:hypothetical protein
MIKQEGRTLFHSIKMSLAARVTNSIRNEGDLKVFLRIGNSLGSLNEGGYARSIENLRPASGI